MPNFSLHQSITFHDQPTIFISPLRLTSFSPPRRKAPPSDWSDNDAGGGAKRNVTIFRLWLIYHIQSSFLLVYDKSSARMIYSFFKQLMEEGHSAFKPGEFLPLNLISFIVIWPTLRNIQFLHFERRDKKN